MSRRKQGPDLLLRASRTRATLQGNFELAVTTERRDYLQALRRAPMSIRIPL
jgi:hypothetical protein